MTPFASAIERIWPVERWRDVHVLLAVSGGADSVAMLRAMVFLKRHHSGSGQLHVAHLNHGARGAESDTEQNWVAELCRRLGVPFWTSRVEIKESKTREGWEAAAREARYSFLTKTAEQIGARFVATAHTVDDQVETILHRILRGTGIDGLTGIPFTRALAPSVTLVRPMLEVTRADVIASLNELQQGYCKDSSNQSLDFTRNWIRHELLPSIRAHVNPDVNRALLRLAQQAAEQRAEIAPRVDRLFAECVAVTEDRITINTLALGTEKQSVLRELCRHAWKQANWPLRDMGFEQWQQLGELMGASDSPAVTFPGAIRAELRNRVLVLIRKVGQALPDG